VRGPLRERDVTIPRRFHLITQDRENQSVFLSSKGEMK
jgi:hypothetical protein